MTATLTPGAYLKHRRQAAGLSVADVAARLPTEPHHSAEHLRIEHLKLIEADAAPMTLTTIVALSRAYPFEERVLYALEEYRQDARHHAPQLCRVCACSHLDPCFDSFGACCHWTADDLCSACSGTAAQAA